MSVHRFWTASILVLGAALNQAEARQRFKNFDVPGASETWPAAINDSNQIAGTYVDKKHNLVHGFIRDSDGTFTTFDPKGSTGTGVVESIITARRRVPFQTLLV